MRMRVGRFGHAAKVWLGIWAVVQGGLALMVRHQGWEDEIKIGLLFALILGLNFLLQISQSAWFDESVVGTKILGGRPVELEYREIIGVRRKRSIARAVRQSGSFDRIEIEGQNGIFIPLSLKHLNIRDLNAMLMQIKARTGLDVPDLGRMK